jgi:hypothetical protein
MSDHHPEISEDRLFFFERQEIVVNNIDASGYILDIGGGGEGVIGRFKGEQVIAIDPNRRELEGAAGRRTWSDARVSRAVLRGPEGSNAP